MAHTAAMLHSIFTYAEALEVRVEYLHGPRFEARQRELLERMVAGLGGSIGFHEVADERVVGLPVTGRFTAAMWYRIFLPELLPDAERVLYLDADTLAVDSLAPLWATDLDGCWLGAVTNVLQHNHLHRPAELGLAGPRVYFNSGVLLMNLAEMRRDGCTDALVEYARAHPDVEWPDQDTLNVVLGGRRRALHPRWNCMNSVLAFPSARRVHGGLWVWPARPRPGIRHFEGPSANKPWHRAAAPAARELYMRHRRATPWPEFELDDDY